MPSERSDNTASGTWFLDDGRMVDHFRVVRAIDRGGMAEVYLAEDTQLGRAVALKVVQPRVLGSAEGVKRFLFEARTTARFNHPHIVTVYAVGEHRGRPYVALEYLKGRTLRQLIDQSPRKLVGIEDALTVGLAITDALRVAHDAGILHRDLKPENVMLTHDDQLRVLDFGLARVFRRSGTSLDDPLTEEHAPPKAAEMIAGDPSLREGSPDMLASVEVLESLGISPRGTPAYMAPEQWEEGDTSGATDIWALGVILFEMVTGRRPFVETSVFKQALNVCSDDPPKAVDQQSSVPPRLSDLIDRCLHKQSERRPSVEEVHECLRELLLTEVGSVRSFKLSTGVSLKSAIQKARQERKASLPQAGKTKAHAKRASWIVGGLLAIAIAVAFSPWAERSSFSRPAAGALDARPASALDARPAIVPVTRNDASAVDSRAPDLIPADAAIQPRTRRPQRRSQARALRRRGTGLLTIDAKPWAIVFLDGRRLDITPVFRRKVPAGRHRLELRNPDRRLVKKLWVVVPKGGELRRMIVLQPKPDKTPKATKATKTKH